MNFEFEFSSVKESNDIRISPAKGVIPGKSSVEIEISYIPNTASTVIAEYKVIHMQIIQI